VSLRDLKQGLEAERTYTCSRIAFTDLARRVADLYDECDQRCQGDGSHMVTAPSGLPSCCDGYRLTPKGRLLGSLWGEELVAGLAHFLTGGWPTVGGEGL
jgi:hypothetical protein